MMTIILTIIWRVPDCRSQFCSIIGLETYIFLSRTVSTLFYENSLNQFYIHTIVVGILYIYFIYLFI